MARGGAGRTMRDNIAAMDNLVSAWLVADGNAVDGTSRTGAQPYDGVVAQFPHEPLSAWQIPAPSQHQYHVPSTQPAARRRARSLDRFAHVVNVKDFGAVFDGNSHPLSSYYPTLASAQAVYPHAVALTDEIDGVAMQAAINLCQSRVTN